MVQAVQRAALAATLGFRCGWPALLPELHCIPVVFSVSLCLSYLLQPDLTGDRSLRIPGHALVALPFYGSDGYRLAVVTSRAYPLYQSRIFVMLLSSVNPPVSLRLGLRALPFAPAALPCAARWFSVYSVRSTVSNTLLRPSYTMLLGKPSRLLCSACAVRFGDPVIAQP